MLLKAWGCVCLNLFCGQVVRSAPSWLIGNWKMETTAGKQAEGTKEAEKSVSDTPVAVSSDSKASSRRAIKDMVIDNNKRFAATMKSLGE